MHNLGSIGPKWSDQLVLSVGLIYADNMHRMPPVPLEHMNRPRYKEMCQKPDTVKSFKPHKDAEEKKLASVTVTTCGRYLGPRLY